MAATIRLPPSGFIVVVELESSGHTTEMRCKWRFYVASWEYYDRVSSCAQKSQVVIHTTDASQEVKEISA